MKLSLSQMRLIATGALSSDMPDDQDACVMCGEGGNDSLDTINAGDNQILQNLPRPTCSRIEEEILMGGMSLMSAMSSGTRIPVSSTQPRTFTITLLSSHSRLYK
jgi:hypothetical protein